MAEDRIKELLQRADKAAGSPRGVSDDLAERVRWAARRRPSVVEPLAAAAALVLAVGLIYWLGEKRTDYRPAEVNPPAMAQKDLDTEIITPEVDQAVTAPLPTERPETVNTYGSDTRAELAALQAEVAQLRAEAEARMKIVQELLVLQKQQAKLARLERQLAGLPDPLDEVHRQLEKAASTKIYFADLKYQKPAQRDSAIEDYRRVIRLYPQTRGAEAARKKLSEIRHNTKGEIL